MNWWKPALIAAGFALALYYGWSCGSSDRDGRIGALKDSLAVIELRADSLAGVQAEVDTVHAQDSVRTVYIIRELEERADSALADALSPQDTLKAALPPRLRPTFDRMLASFGVALWAKDSTILEHEETIEFQRDRIRIRDGRILELQDGWNTEKRLRKEIEKPDINLFGLGLEFTCGPQIGLGLVTPGELGAYFGVGCTVGK